MPEALDRVVEALRASIRDLWVGLHDASQMPVTAHPLSMRHGHR
jgi:hypothetical protein